MHSGNLHNDEGSHRPWGAAPLNPQCSHTSQGGAEVTKDRAVKLTPLP